jgi:hypothetical protein
LAETDLNPDIRDIKAALGRFEPVLTRIGERLNATLPHLATKAELADKPGKVWLAGAIAVLLAAYAAGLAGFAALPALRAMGG